MATMLRTVGWRVALSSQGAAAPMAARRAYNPACSSAFVAVSKQPSLSFSSCPLLRKSKRSFASEPAPDAPGEVPVMRTKGKGAKGAGSEQRGARTKRGSQEEDTMQDDDRYTTTTTNNALPGEKFADGKQKENMQRTVQRCRETVSRLVGSHGRADPAMLEGVRVSLPSSEPPKGPTKNRQEAGPSVSIKELATVGIRDGALLVTCFDASTVKYVERGIYNADLGLTPQHLTDGEEGVLRIPIPRPTAESRAQLVKEVNNVCENARVSIRVARQTAKKQIDGDVKRKVIGKDESRLEMSRIEEETKNRTAEVNKLQEETRKRLET